MRTQITRARRRKGTGTTVLRAGKFGDLTTPRCSWWRVWISKQSSICCRGRRFGNSMDSILSVQNKNFSRNRQELAKVLGADVETKSHLHWQFHRNWPSLWRSFLESLYVNTSPFRNKWDCWERYVGLRSELLLSCCNHVWMKIGGQIPWNATAICETFKIYCLMGKHLTNGDSANHSKDL